MLHGFFGDLTEIEDEGDGAVAEDGGAGNGLDVFVEAAEFLNDSFVVADDEVDEKAAFALAGVGDHELADGGRSPEMPKCLRIST